MGLLCNPCADLVAAAIKKAIDNGATDCADLGEMFMAECEAASAGPEDVVGDVVCAAATAVIVGMCNDVEFDFIKSNVDQFSKSVCEKIGLCDSSSDNLLFTAASNDPLNTASWGNYPAQLSTDITSSKAPATTTLDGKEYVAYLGTGDGGTYIYVAASDNPRSLASWNKNPNHLPTQATTPAAPAVIGYKGMLYVVFTGFDDNIYLMASNDPLNPVSWDNQTPGRNPIGLLTGTATTTQAPALAVFNDTLYVVYTGKNGNIYVMGSNDPLNKETWAQQTPNGNPVGLPLGDVLTNVAPAVTVFNNRLYVVLTCRDNTLHVIDSPNPLFSWPEGPQPIPSAATSLVGPSVAVFNKMLYVLFTGTNNRLFSLGSADPLNPDSWGDSPVHSLPDSFTSTMSPSATVFGDMLYVTYRSSAT